MSYLSEHNRMRPVLDMARKLDIATNPEPEAIFESGGGGFQIWCTPQTHPKGWDNAKFTKGAFAKPCCFVASVAWGWTDETITDLDLETDAYGLRDIGYHKPIHNRPDDINWAIKQIHYLFNVAQVPCPPIVVDGRKYL